jgi:hypothetical protein
MIDRQYGKLVFECDACEATFEGDNDDFQADWAAAKREGWKTRQIGSDWVHTCPECSQ